MTRMLRSVLFSLLLTGDTFRAAAADWLVLDDLVLIDGSGAPARPVAQLVIRDGVIERIGEAAEIPAE